MIREAIILAGGFGTRLKPVVDELPKPMAPVGGRPFLEYLLDYLAKYGINRAIIAAGYKHELISSHFGYSYKEIEIEYSIETEPLGTGGAILKATGALSAGKSFILNGDTFFNADLIEFSNAYTASESVLSIALKPMNAFKRYGCVTVDNDKIVSFDEKKFCSSGLINGGLYLIDKVWLRKSAPGKIFSFENDIMEKLVTHIKISYFISDTYFIDIGIPEDFLKANRELPLL